MPADSDNRDRMSALRRLVQLFGAWRQHRAARRNHWRSFTSLSDRTLADIGVRRADVHAAVVGAMSLGRHPPTEVPPEATICRLPGRPRLRVVADDLGAAA